MGSAGIRLRAYQGVRDIERFPREDSALGEAVFGLVKQSLSRGTPRPALFVFFENQVDRFDLAPLMRQPRVSRDRMIAAMAGQTGVECVALLGVLRLRRSASGEHGRAAVTFIEWPDNRWWTSWMPIDSSGVPSQPELEARTAVEGFPRPGGVGGWFSLARRSGIQLHLAGQAGTVH